MNKERIFRDFVGEVLASHFNSDTSVSLVYLKDEYNINKFKDVCKSFEVNFTNIENNLNSDCSKRIKLVELSERLIGFRADFIYVQNFNISEILIKDNEYIVKVFDNIRDCYDIFTPESKKEIKFVGGF